MRRKMGTQLQLVRMKVCPGHPNPWCGPPQDCCPLLSTRSLLFLDDSLLCLVLSAVSCLAGP